MTIEDVRYPPDRAHVGSARRHAMDLAAEAAPAGRDPHDRCGRGARRHLDRSKPAGDRRRRRHRRRPHRRRPASRKRVSVRGSCTGRDCMPGTVSFATNWRRLSIPWTMTLGRAITITPAVASRCARRSTARSAAWTQCRFARTSAFVSKVRAAGYRLSHPLDVIVTVSARTQGRAKGGMADCLRTWIREEAEGTPVLFECPAAVEERLRRRKAIRDLAGRSARDCAPHAAGPWDRARPSRARSAGRLPP